jgi:hypothetical protein
MFQPSFPEIALPSVLASIRHAPSTPLSSNFSISIKNCQPIRGADAVDRPVSDPSWQLKFNI